MHVYPEGERIKAINTWWISRSYPYKYIIALTKKKPKKNNSGLHKSICQEGLKLLPEAKRIRLRVCCFVRHWSWNLLIRKDLCHIPNRSYQSAAICRSASNEILRFFYLSIFFLLLRSEMILNSHWGEQIKKLFIYELILIRDFWKQLLYQRRNLFIYLINAFNSCKVNISSSVISIDLQFFRIPNIFNNSNSNVKWTVNSLCELEQREFLITNTQHDYMKRKSTYVLFVK